MKTATLVFVVLLAAGCSSSKAATTAVASSSTTTSAPTNSVPPGATVTQWASFIREKATPVRRAAGNVKDCVSFDQSVTCRLGHLSFSLSAQTLGIQVATASNPGTDTLGDPPREIKDLVQRTIDGGDAVKTAEGDVEASCVNAKLPDCDQKFFAWMSARDDFMAVLNGWSTYGG